ncbi:MAG: hypothetical protein HOP37_14350 [Cyclobacteriaceae bacterium]|nr:hypothetical protein [Cyclobacteriaceae bacterium]
MKRWGVRMCTYKDLCALYGVSYKIIKQQLKPFEKEIGEKHGNFFSILQVIKIFEFLGEPSEIEIIYPVGYRPARVNHSPNTQ